MRRILDFPLIGLALVLVALLAGFAIIGPLLLAPTGPIQGTVFGTPTMSATAASELGEALSTPAYPTAVLNTVVAVAPASTELELSPVPTGTPTASPSPPPTKTLTPSPSPSPTQEDTPTPAPTSRLTWTPTLAPTLTPTASATPRPTNTPRPAAPRTSTPVPTSLPPLTLGYPPDGQSFGEGDIVVLQWKPLNALPDDAFYVPTVTYLHSGQTWSDETPWTKASSWTLSEHGYLPSLSDDGVFRWSVQVMRQTGVDPITGKPVGVPLSPPSETRTLHWAAPPTRPTRTPIPP